MNNRAYSLWSIKKIDAAQRIIEGIASTPTPDRGGDVMMPNGAQFQLPLPFLWFHNSMEPIGEVFAATVKPDGIHIKARVSRVEVPGRLKDLVDDAWAAFTATPMLVRGLSIGWKPIESEPIKGTTFTRVARWLWAELSAVTIPMNADCTISAVKQFDTAPVASDGSRPVSPAGAAAHSIRKGTKMTIAENIAAYQQKRDATAAQIAGMVQKTIDDGSTFDESDTARYNELKSELAATDRHIGILRESETMNLEKATPLSSMHVERPATTPPPPAQLPRIQIKSNLPPGTAFTRACMAIADGRGDYFRTLERAKSWNNETPEVELLVKAAVAAGTTTDSTWAGPLAVTQPINEFLELLRPRTLLGRIPGIRQVPFNVSVPAQTAGGSYGWVRQGYNKPLTNATLATVSVGFAKAAGIIVLTEELVKLSTPSAEAVVREEMIAGISKFLDEQFVDPAVAAVSNVNPASITNGASTAAASGTDGAAARADLAASVAVFTAANVPLDGAVWLMNDSNAFALSIALNAIGQPLFPGMTGTGGTLFGRPVVVSNNVGSRIILLHAPSIFVADEGGVRVDVSREATVQMDSAPDNPATASTVMVSLWQGNLVGLRAERMISWTRGRTAAVRYISSAAYTGA